MDSFRRKTPEELLYSIYRIQRGRLKVYIGAVSGSGKTYQMLNEGQKLKDRGIDVVACAVSTKRRPETVEQLAGLDRVPSIHWMQGDEEKKDLDVDALLKRNPEVVLVDGLAHRNRPGAERRTRLDDIRVLLGQGIGVIATVNAYELEGVTQLARKLTGIEAEATIPADTLELADEVRLIDVSPETILKRLEEGNLGGVKDPGFLKRGNVGKLRELALRLMAEDVNESLEKHREEQGLQGASGAAERILVSAQYHWNGSIYIRRGQQIARRLGGDLMVVTFVKPRRGKAPSKEAGAFKQSIAKLTEKIGAKFEEVPLPSRRKLPKELIRYATVNNVTCIVLGHSKQSRWQELWNGSVVNGILRRASNIDVFFIADRADHEGERVLPAKSRAPQPAPSEPYRRLSAQEIERKIEKMRRGKFKVYIGAAPGVGKTYRMLREGNDLLRKSIDAVIGYLETHGREETIAQVGSLPAIPRSVYDYRGTKLEEMDVPAIIARNPEVVLIDELAHTNVHGSKNKKRYEDVLEVLDAGISVIATLNVQHLESLNDAVEQIAGVRVRETVPDGILRLADEVELIDVTPKALQERLREGRIYAMNKVEQALDHFFKTGNLIALRELALREIADDVDERLEAWERNGSLRGPYGRREVIFVCVTTSGNAERLIRRGFRIAHRLKAEWRVLYVHSGRELRGELERRVRALREMTVRLGGKFEMERVESRNRVPDMLMLKANEYRSTQMVIGQSSRKWWEPLLRKSVVKTVLERGRHMDVLVIADFKR
ncbi:universal stress protein [Cohnella faecalis]|uniref:Histidine kinase n=1 Tax=Cohnella faecalis TaxID=2315694 RepID=A0A398CI98_9BACL|nr:universal stress protein [Cohnella faecalis]RIE02170.1 histidine kinase [Cohnella faecalis]